MASEKATKIFIAALDDRIAELRQEIVDKNQEMAELEVDRQLLVSGNPRPSIQEFSNREPPSSGALKDRIIAALPRVPARYTIDQLIEAVNADGGPRVTNRETLASTHSKFKGSFFKNVRRASRSIPALYEKIAEPKGEDK